VSELSGHAVVGAWCVFGMDNVRTLIPNTHNGDDTVTVVLKDGTTRECDATFLTSLGLIQAWQSFPGLRPDPVPYRA
jgi:hypothetical protein